MAQLVVENASGGGAAPDEVSDGSGLGTQLIEAFARQLNGTLERRDGPDSYRLSLVFPLHALTEAEARQNGGPIDNAAE